MFDMTNGNEENVLCACSVYEKKFYFNQRFEKLPEAVKEELQIMCVMFTEEIGGELVLMFDEDGTLLILSRSDEDDILYDEIGSGLKVKQLQRGKSELFEQLELFYQSFFLTEGRNKDVAGVRCR